MVATSQMTLTASRFLLTWKVTVISVCSSSSVVCVLAIIFILASKGYKHFVHRLTLYLIVVDLLKAVVTIPDVLPVYHNGTVVAVRSGFEGFCFAVGFFLEVVAWMEKLVICWIVVYLVMVLVFRHNANAVKVKHEACGIAVVLLLPLLVTWVPFVKNMYGLSEAVCWIKLSENSTCNYDYIGLTFLFVFYYGPVRVYLCWHSNFGRTFHHIHGDVQESYETGARFLSTIHSSTEC